MPAVDLETLERRSRELARKQAQQEHGRQLASKLDDLKRDLADVESRRDALARLGNGHVELREQFHDRRYRIQYELEPRRSKLTGKQLAAQLELDAAALRDELKRTRAELDTLLEG